MNLIFNPLFQKIVGTLALAAILSGGYYMWHVKPIKDLTEKNEKQKEILDETKDKVDDSKTESDLFEDKWKTIKDIIWEPSIVLDINETNNTEETPQKDIHENIDTSIGEHLITI